MIKSISTILVASAAILFYCGNATAYDFSACDPQTDPDNCECPSGATACEAFDANDIPDFRNGTYSTEWIDVVQSDPNSSRYTVVFNLKDAPGHGVVIADDSPWADVGEVESFLQSLTGVAGSDDGVKEFNLVQVGESVMVDSNGERTDGSSKIWLMNVLMNKAGEIDIDGVPYDPKYSPLNIDGISFPGGSSSLFDTDAGSCADLIVIDASDNLWEADQCTYVDNTSASSYFNKTSGFASSSSITNLTKNGLGSTIEVNNSGSVPSFRLERVEAQLSEATFETLDRGPGPESTLTASEEKSEFTDMIFVENLQFTEERLGEDGEEFWTRGECGSGTLKVDALSDTDHTSHGWVTDEESACPQSEGTD